MAQGTQLARLARLSNNLKERVREYIEFGSQLDRLESIGEITAGQRVLHKRLGDRLDQAKQILEALERSNNRDSSTQLNQLDASLSGVEWDVARGQCEQAKKLADAYDLDFREWRSRAKDVRAEIEELEDQVSKAHQRRVPIGDDEVKAARLSDLLNRAERDLDTELPLEGAAGALRELVRTSLDALSRDKIQSLTESIRKKIGSIPRYPKRVDITLLQLPVDRRKRYTYSVVLRTQGERRPVNLRDSRPVVKQDRDQIRDALDEITAQVNGRLQRRAAEAGQVGPSAEIAPGGAGQAEIANAGAAPRGRPAGAEPHDGESAEAQAGQALQGAVAAGNGPVRFGAVEAPDGAGDQSSSLGLADLIRTVGEQMYRFCVPEQMRSHLMGSPGYVTLTTNDVELPWELMCYRRPEGAIPDREAEAQDDPHFPEDGECTFLCLEQPVARMPMGRGAPRANRSRPRQDKIRFLLIHADPGNTLSSAWTEVVTIRDKLKAALGDDIEITIRDREKVNGRELNRLLLGGNYDVIHYAGHAYFDRVEPSFSGLLLQKDDVFHSLKVQQLLEGEPLVFLNACESSRTANEAEAERKGYLTSYLQAPTEGLGAEGLASAFIYGGARACVGALWPIYDGPAAEFAVQFYTLVLQGYTIGEAMRLARIRIRRANPEDITWAAFVLYGDPTFVLAEPESIEVGP